MYEFWLHQSFREKLLEIDEKNVNDKEHLLIINIDAAGADTVTLPQLELQNIGQNCLVTAKLSNGPTGMSLLNVIDLDKAQESLLLNGTVMSLDPVR